MISRLDETLNFHHQALNLSTQRQQILAGNIANADVPQFKARDIDFTKALKAASSQGAGSVALKVTSSRHQLPAAAGGSVGADLLYRVPHQDSIDGNTVDMDVERAQFADNAIRVEANLTFLNSQLKGILAAIQG